VGEVLGELVEGTLDLDTAMQRAAGIRRQGACKDLRAVRRRFEHRIAVLV